MTPRRGRARRALLTLVIFLLVAPSSLAKTIPVPAGWHAPKGWLADAVCIHQKEGAWGRNSGNGYFGGMQWKVGTWIGAGGRWMPSFDHPGDEARWPFEATPREELFYAYLVWDRDKGKPHDGIGSWREWGTAQACHLR